MTTSVVASGEIVRREREYPDAPEQVMVPGDDGVAREERVKRAYEKALRSWDVIGKRLSLLGRRRANATIHAFRTEPRGYGEKRLRFRETTECGMTVPKDGYDRELWWWKRGTLADTTCRSCRQWVRERFEREVDYGLVTGDPRYDGDAAADEYDRIYGILTDEEAGWDEQRRRHECAAEDD